MKLTCDAIVDGEYLIVPEGTCERLRIHLSTPFGRLSDGAVKPLNMADAIERLRAANFAIGYRGRTK